MLTQRIHPEASAELLAAAQWYDDQEPGLGLELVQEFEQRLDFIQKAPNVGAAVGETPGGASVRTSRLKHFAKYTIYFTASYEELTILAFAHSRRRPGRWKKRT